MKQEVVLYNVMKRSGHVTDCHKGKIGCNFTDEWQSSFFATKSSKILTIEGSQNTKADVVILIQIMYKGCSCCYRVTRRVSLSSCCFTSPFGFDVKCRELICDCPSKADDARCCSASVYLFK
jgi:hypothetical protein